MHVQHPVWIIPCGSSRSCSDCVCASAAGNVHECSTCFRPRIETGTFHYNRTPDMIPDASLYISGNSFSSSLRVSKLPRTALAAKVNVTMRVACSSLTVVSPSEALLLMAFWTNIEYSSTMTGRCSLDDICMNRQVEPCCT